jgi:hypothetical protein
LTGRLGLEPLTSPPPIFVPPPLSLHYRLVDNFFAGEEVMLMEGNVEMEAETELSRDFRLS